MRKIVFNFNDIEGIEITNEQQVSDRKKETTQKDLYESINDIMKRQSGKFGVGIHAIRKETVKGQDTSEILQKICDEGLKIKKGSSILATVSSLGVSSELRNHQKESIMNYKLGSEKAENGVIVLVPTVLEGIEEQLYVGFPGIDTSAVGNNHKTTCILDQVCCGNNDFGEIPKEFILGYFKEENGERVFQKNEHHFLDLSDEEKEIFIKGLSDRLTEQQKQVSKAVIDGDFQRLEEISEETLGNRDGVLGDNTVIQNAIMYLNRNIDRQKETTDDMKRGKPRILLDTYKSSKVNQTDLSTAYTTISKSKEERERNNIRTRNS